MYAERVLRSAAEALQARREAGGPAVSRSARARAPREAGGLDAISSGRPMESLCSFMSFFMRSSMRPLVVKSVSCARQAPYEAEGAAQELANADALPLLLALLRAAAPAAQAWGLAALLRLLRGSIANLSACDRRGPGRGVAQLSVEAQRACPRAASACGRGEGGLAWTRRLAAQQRLALPAAPPGCRAQRAAPPCVRAGPAAGISAFTWSLGATKAGARCVRSGPATCTGERPSPQNSGATGGGGRRVGLNGRLIAWLAAATEQPALQAQIAEVLQVSGAFSISGAAPRVCWG